MALLWEILASLLGVVLAPLMLQSIFKPKTRFGRAVAVIAGVLAVVACLSVWGLYQRDPVQLAFCRVSAAALSKPLPACVDARTDPLDVHRLYGSWRKIEDPSCRAPLVIGPQGGDLRVRLEDTAFIERVESRAVDAARTLVLSPAPAAGQRFQFRLLDNGRTLEVEPLYGGSSGLWRKCEIQP